MQIPKLQVLIEAGAVRAVEVAYAPESAGWTVAITYASRHGERREGLERQRGGAGRGSSPPWTPWPGVWPGWACRRSEWTPAA